jgi:Tfp pilus assembly protein PilF
MPSPSLKTLARPTAPRQTAAALAVTLAVGSGTACSGKQGNQPGAQSPERQSEAEYDLARDLFQKGNPRAALDHAQKAVALNDDNEKAHYFVAAIYLSFCSTNRGLEAPDCKLSEVEKSTRLALKANPQFRDATNLLGQVLINQKRFKEAIQILEPLTKDAAYIHPYFAWGNLGWAQVLDGQLDPGIASLKNAVTEPRFCVGHYRLGVAYEKKGDPTGAEQSFTTALTVPDPNCENLQDAWEARGRVRVRLGRPNDARQDYEKCRDISAETPTGKLCAQRLAALGPGAQGGAKDGAAPTPAPAGSSPSVTK